MDQLFETGASKLALVLESISILLICYGAVEALFRLLIGRPSELERSPFGRGRFAFVHFGAWLILGLEFELAADIVRSAISPTWNDIGQLAAIAAIRTFLNYFLEKDVKEFAEAGEQSRAKIDPERTPAPNRG